jgi:tetratricopeptide (TPR) repeat protein
MEIIIGIAGLIFTGAALYIAYLQLKRTPKSIDEKISEEGETVPKPRPPKKRTSYFINRFNHQGHSLKASVIESLQKNVIVSLWGSGGVGKTTLAIEVSHELLTQLDGVIWIGLETYDDFSLPKLLNEICIQFKREDALTLPIDVKKALVRSLLDNGKYLLVVDNFEIIREVDIIIAFLAGLSCSSLITTREILSNTYNMEISEMESKEAEELIQWLLRESRERRWLQHISLSEIIQITEGNPTLIQWIISQLDLAVQPNQVFNDLRSGSGAATQRVFGRSYSLLSEKAQEVLLSLSLFRAGATDSSLIQICEISDSTQLSKYLLELRKLRLIDALLPSERTSLRGLTRDLSNAKLLTDKRGLRIKRNFITFFLNYSEANSEEKPGDFASLETERDNLIGAMELSFQLEDWQMVIRFWNFISTFLWVKGYWDEYVACDELTLEAAKKHENQEIIATVLSELGWVSIDRGDYEKAVQMVNQAHAIFTELGNHYWRVTTMIYMGIANYRAGFLEEAESFYKRAMEIAEQEQLEERIGTLKNYLGSLYRKQGDLVKARQVYQESLAIHGRANNNNRLMATFRNLGALEFTEGNFAKSREYYNNGLNIAMKSEKKDMIAGLSYKLAELEEKEGNLESALNLASLAELSFRELKMGKDRNLAQEMINRLKRVTNILERNL